MREIWVVKLGEIRHLIHVSCHTPSGGIRNPAVRGGVSLTTIQSKKVQGLLSQRLVKLKFYKREPGGTRTSQSYAYCTGTIISGEWILTAAHCFTEFFDFSKKEQWYVAIVRFDLTGQEELLFEANTDDVLLHPSYVLQKQRKVSAVNRASDIALVKTSGKMRSFDFSPLKMSSAKSLRIGDQLLICGFGYNPLQQSSNFEKNRLAVGLATVYAYKREGVLTPSSSDLNDAQKKLVEGWPTGSFYIEHELQGLCEGDSGGPVFKMDQEYNLALVGLNFTGTCAQYLDVHSKAIDISETDNFKFLETHVGSQLPMTTVSNLENLGESLGLENTFGCEGKSKLASYTGGEKNLLQRPQMQENRVYHLKCKMSLNRSFSGILFRNHLISSHFRSDANYCKSCVDEENKKLIVEKKACLKGQPRCLVDSISPERIDSFNERFLKTKQQSEVGTFDIFLPREILFANESAKTSLILVDLPVVPTCEVIVFDNACEVEVEDLDKMNRNDYFLLNPYKQIDPEFDFK